MGALSFPQIDKILCGVNVDSYNRFDVFLSFSDQLHGKEYWYALKYAYSTSDNLYRHRHAVKKAFSKDEPFRKYLMCPSEQKALAKLPNDIIIYRGLTEAELKTNQFGVSWTLKKSIAEFFAFSYGRNFPTAELPKTVHSLQVKKTDLVAFFNERNEYEVIFIENCFGESLKTQQSNVGPP